MQRIEELFRPLDGEPTVVGESSNNTCGYRFPRNLPVEARPLTTMVDVHYVHQLLVRLRAYLEQNAAFIDGHPDIDFAFSTLERLRREIETVVLENEADSRRVMERIFDLAKRFYDVLGNERIDLKCEFAQPRVKMRTDAFVYVVMEDGTRVQIVGWEYKNAMVLRYHGQAMLDRSLPRYDDRAKTVRNARAITSKVSQGHFTRRRKLITSYNSSQLPSGTRRPRIWCFLTDNSCSPCRSS
jgi:hypothetical protein